MTENNRFGVMANDENFLIIIDNERALSQLQVCSLLNDFYNECKELKYNYDELSVENVMLKAQVKQLQRELEEVEKE